MLQPFIGIDLTDEWPSASHEAATQVSLPLMDRAGAWLHGRAWGIGGGGGAATTCLGMDGHTACYGGVVGVRGRTHVAGRKIASGLEPRIGGPHLSATSGC